MYVIFGMDCSKVGLRDLTSDDPEKVRYYRVPGNRELEVKIPDGMRLAEAFQSVNLVLREQHMLRDHHLPGDVEAAPLWVESDSAGLSALFAEEFGGIPTERPSGWEVEWHDADTSEELDDQPVTVAVTHTEES